MIDQVQKRVLILALFAGELMMKSGAEIYRVEDTITRICRACKIPYVECFATTTGIFLSVDSGAHDGDMHTFIKRIKSTSIDLARISLINKFSREFTSTDLSIEEGFERLKEIERRKPYPLAANWLATMLVGFSLCMCLGGNPLDSVIAGVVTGLMYLVSTLISKLQFNFFIQTFAGCALCGFVSLSIATTGLLTGLNPFIIASVTIFLPGVAITNAARDLLSGDMLAGLSRFAEAVIIAIAIAGGVGVVMKLWTMSGGIIPESVYTSYPPLLLFGLACLASFSFCIIFHVPPAHILFASLVGGCGFSGYLYVQLLGQSIVTASFLGSCIVAILAECASRAGKDATTLFIIPGIIPLVPGTGMYTTMLFTLEGDFTQVAESGSQTFLIAGGIAVALIAIASLTRFIMEVSRKISLVLHKSR